MGVAVVCFSVESFAIIAAPRAAVVIVVVVAVAHVVVVVAYSFPD